MPSLNQAAATARKRSVRRQRQQIVHGSRFYPAGCRTRIHEVSGDPPVTSRYRRREGRRREMGSRPCSSSGFAQPVQSRFFRRVGQNCREHCISHVLSPGRVVRTAPEHTRRPCAGNLVCTARQDGRLRTGPQLHGGHDAGTVTKPQRPNNTSLRHVVQHRG